MTTIPSIITTTLDRRLAVAGKPGRRDDNAFEALRCLEAIELLEIEPREGGADFIERMIRRAAVLLGVVL